MEILNYLRLSLIGYSAGALILVGSLPIKRWWVRILILSAGTTLAYTWGFLKGSNGWGWW